MTRRPSHSKPKAPEVTATALFGDPLRAHLNEVQYGAILLGSLIEALQVLDADTDSRFLCRPLLDLALEKVTWINEALDSVNLPQVAPLETGKS